jgi:hypothetical protein
MTSEIYKFMVAGGVVMLALLVVWFFVELRGLD